MTAVFTVAVVDEPAATEPEEVPSETENPFVVVPPPPELLVNGAKALLKNQVLWEMPEQLSEPAVPTQPPLSRSSAQKDRVLMPLLSAQASTVLASAVVKVSAAP